MLCAILKAWGRDKFQHDSESPICLATVLAIALLTPSFAFAAEPVTDASVSSNAFKTALPLFSADHELFYLAQNSADTEPRESLKSAEIKANKSYTLPAGEIVAFNVLLNRFNYYFIDKEVYGTTYESFRRNVTGRWVVDTDPFAMNQFMHPYQGSVYFGLARSSGLDFWESMKYSFGGSLFWELAGESGPPSINDLFTTGFGGAFLGEPLFRMANLLLEKTKKGEEPGFWREVGAAAISPTLGFTRNVFGDRFRTVFDSHNPAVYTYLRLGWNKVDNVFDEVVSQTVKRDAVTADFRMAYGLPGRAGYTYTRPFDYFDFEFTASSANVFENIMTHGLLYGKEYQVGEAYRGVWGLYGSYDYISPQTFRVSSTALSFGSTAQWWFSKNFVLQGTALGGVGYGAAGTIHGSGERDYHYGATPQTMLALRMLFGERANLDLTARSYYVSDVLSTEDRGSERIFRGEAAFTVRAHGPHAVTLKYNTSQRNAQYPDLPNTHQSVKTLSLLYTYLFGDAKFGAVEWLAPPGVAEKQ
ncbi:MAG: DUF3943 domain-containing protein [Gammaproteobacteria bacterium]|nr:DUF3943 domain-containing protein [Gammaproteobacteria bacterium]